MLTRSLPFPDLATLLSPEIVQMNRLPARATFSTYPEPSQARHLTPSENPWICSLDGTWQAHLARDPAEAFAFFEKSGDESPWQPMQVPGHWQLQGFWDLPHYTNIDMPFDLEAPLVPEQNPTCVCRRAFRLPPGWEDKRVVLHFGGADNTLLVFLNGQFIGLSKDSRSPAEFDITSHLRRDRENVLVAVVIKWSGTSWIEDQDHWWLSGLHRSVFLQATNPIYLADVQVRAGLANDYQTGTLDLRVAVGFPYLAEADCHIEAQLYDARGRAVFRKALNAKIDPSRQHYMRWPGPAAWITANVPRVKKWSAEIPELYTLIVTLNSPRGTESTRVRVGFRSLEIRNRSLLINGKRVLIKGVNRHDHDDRGGKTVPREMMLKDVLTMKRFNVNAVRTSHYPNDPYFYDLCDEYGLYVIDEANIEAHAQHNLICRDPRFAPAFLNHLMNMVERDKNHPCIYAWSLGNESGRGPNHDAIAGWARAADPTRLLHYEGGISKIQGRFQWGNDPTQPVTWDDGHAVTDFVCPMYPGVDEMVAWCRNTKDRRPMILCEFSHAMGNGNGCLAEYFDAFEKTPGLQGGYIWQWIDHGLKKLDAAGRSYWAYGGDFGDTPNDGNFLCGGLVWPDRTPHTGLFEFKKLARPIGIKALDAAGGRLRITNKQNFQTLGWLSATWEVSTKGQPVLSGKMPHLDTLPGASANVRLRFKKPAAEGSGESFLTIRFHAKNATAWCPAGHEIAAEQFAISRKIKTTAAKSAGDPFQCDEAPKHITFSRGALVATVDKQTGSLSSLCVSGRELLVAGPELNIWRPPTDNDGLKVWSGQEHKPLGRWLAAGLDQPERSVRSLKLKRQKNGNVLLEINHLIAVRGGYFEHREILTFRPGGEIKVDNVVVASQSLPELPRIGVSLILSAELEHLQWFGRGPLETYPDRQRGMLVGLYSSTVTEQYVPYIMPQEHGNHTDVRWFSLVNDQRRGLRFSGNSLIQFSASHLHPDDLFRARHTIDLQPRPEVFLTIDHLHRGVGTGSCGPDTLPKYLIQPGRFRFTYSIAPL